MSGLGLMSARKIMSRIPADYLAMSTTCFFFTDLHHESHFCAYTDIATIAAQCSAFSEEAPTLIHWLILMGDFWRFQRKSRSFPRFPRFHRVWLPCAFKTNFHLEDLHRYLPTCFLFATRNVTSSLRVFLWGVPITLVYNGNG